MGELYNPYPKLPKNIRQLGDRDDVVKLYVEDYVNIYLKHLYPTGGQELRVGLLLGSVEQHDGMPYIFVDGAMEMEDATITGEKVTFSEAAWKKAYQSIEETFPKRTIQGWFLCGAPGCSLSPLNYWKQHGQYFGGKNQLMYLNFGIDGDEAVYITSDDGFYKLRGYSIFFERNQMMQDYMILRKDARRVESGANDRVIRDFRERLEGRKREAVSRRGTVRTLGTLCSVLSVAVLAGGVVMFNNYQKMKEMETVLVSVLPSGAKNWKAFENRDQDDDVIVEEIKGSVRPVETDASMSMMGQTSGATESTEAESGPAETVQALPSSVSTENLTGQSEISQPEVGNGQAMAGQPQGDEAVLLDEPEEALDASANVLGSGGNATAAKDFPTTTMKPGKTYTVGDGETLYGICFKQYDSLSYLDDICALNQISDVDKITAGQELILPDLTGIQ